MLGRFRLAPAATAPAAGARPGPATASVVATRRSTVHSAYGRLLGTGAFYRFPDESQMIAG